MRLERLRRSPYRSQYQPAYWVDGAKAIDTHLQAKESLAVEATTPGLRHTLVVTAVIMSFTIQE